MAPMVAAPDPEKSRLRVLLRAARGARAEAEWQADSAVLCRQIATLSEVQRCDTIALFWPLLRRREPDLRPLDAELRALGKQLYYPAMHGAEGDASWGFGLTRSAAELHPVAGLFEPALDCARAEPGEIQVIVAPCLALDDMGYRLGYGAGYYDRMLQRFAPPAFVIGVCFESERRPSLPREAHDVAVDWIVTPQSSRAALR